jgi:hypothetical protein
MFNLTVKGGVVLLEVGGAERTCRGRLRQFLLVFLNKLIIN